MSDLTQYFLYYGGLFASIGAVGLALVESGPPEMTGAKTKKEQLLKVFSGAAKGGLAGAALGAFVGFAVYEDVQSRNALNEDALANCIEATPEGEPVIYTPATIFNAPDCLSD